MAPTETAFRIRTATLADAPAIAEIYAPYVRETDISFEEVPPTAEEMAARMEPLLPKYPFLVAEMEGRIVGFAYASRHHGRAAYRWSVDIAVYVDRNSRRHGIGRALYGKLLPALTAQGFVTAVALIVLPNAPSMALHVRLGFRHSGTLENIGFKHGRWLHVGYFTLQLQRPLPAQPAEPQPSAQSP